MPIAAAGLMLLGGCGGSDSGPLLVSAIGEPPDLVNPNLAPVDPPRAFLLEAVAQGLVRFNARGEIEPALAQSWIVSDDGLRYTFRLQRTHWSGGDRVTAEQVVARLRAAISRASRNPLKQSLGTVAAIVPMTEQVLEITLKAPRPNFLQLLAQPEMAVLRDGEGTGPYRVEEKRGEAVLLSVPEADEGEEAEPLAPDILLRGERAARAVARFAAGEADLVIGGTINDLPLARAGVRRADALRFDPVAGLLGLEFGSASGALADPAVRRALSMALDREALLAAFGVPGLEPRTSLLPRGIEDAQPALPAWSDAPMAMRREQAARAIAAATEGEPLRIRVALPEGPGYRLVFAHLRQDWRAIGVEAERVDGDAEAELRFVDAVAPSSSSGWYLRHFLCGRNPVCDPQADRLLEAARIVPSAADRRILIAAADAILTEAVPFIPIAAPVRWSLVSTRLTGFRANAFARHGTAELVGER